MSRASIRGKAVFHDATGRSRYDGVDAQNGARSETIPVMPRAKRALHAVAAIVLTICLLSGCTLQEAAPDLPGVRPDDARLTCKESPETDRPPSGSIGLRIEYEYDEPSRTLRVRHVDTLLNCCPQMIGARVVVTGQRIEAREHQRLAYLGPCSCLCLHDIEYSIDDISPTVHFLHVSVLYSRREGAPPLFDFGSNDIGPLLLDLANHPAGTFFFERDYHWL